MDLTNEEIIALIFARFEPLKQAEGLKSFDEIRRDLPRFADFKDYQLTRTIQQGFKDGLVELQRGESGQYEPPKPDEALSSRLQDPFKPRGFATGTEEDGPGLARAMVIPRNPASTSDDLVRDLGWAFADWLKVAGIRVRRIGIGPGQSVFRVSERCRDRGIDGNGVTFAALTGRFSARSPNPKEKNVLIDADMNAVRFGTGLTGQANYALLGSLAVLPEAENDRHILVSGSWMAEDFQVASNSRDSSDDFRHAIVGVGVLSQNWKFGDAVWAIGGMHDPIQGELDELKRLSEEIAGTLTLPAGMPRFTPVGDIACHLFAVEPPRGFSIRPEQREKLEKLLKRINSRIFTLRPERLQKMKLWVVSGGAEKAHALRHILQTHRVEFLVTDNECAEAILATVPTRPPAA